jgi:hypothetical protein
MDQLTISTRRYKLAEKLSERLDEMGKDLTSMIEEVNGASATISKTNRADEPVSFPLSYHCLMSHAHDCNRSLKSSVSSTRIFPSCRSSTREPQSYKPRLRLPRRQDSQSPRALVTAIPALVWAMVMPPMISTVPTWEDGKWTSLVDLMILRLRGDD